MVSEKAYTIRVCYDVKGWAYYRRACALQKYAPADFEVTIGPDYGRAFKQLRHDLVLQLCYSYAKDIKRHIEKNEYGTLVVSSFNVGFGYANKWLEECRQWSDHVVINNRECWESTGRQPDTSWISNGVDTDQFKISVPPAARKPRVLWIGSKCHRKTKRYDQFLVPLQERLAAVGIESDFRVVDSHGGSSRMNQSELVQWYNTGTIYVVASSSEGTPNPALESAAAGCVVVATPVGNMPELIEQGVNGEIAEHSIDSLFAAIVRCQSRYLPMSAAMQQTIRHWSWQHRSAQYFDLFRRLLARECDLTAYKQ